MSPWRVTAAALLLVVGVAAFGPRLSPATARPGPSGGLRSRWGSALKASEGGGSSSLGNGGGGVPLRPPPLLEGGEQSMSGALEQAQKLQRRKLFLSVDCKICGTTNQHFINKQSYENEMVIVVCSGCGGRHLIADQKNKLNLNFKDLSAYYGESAVTRGTIPPVDLTRYSVVPTADGGWEVVPKS
eukprot:CAMPEP_0198434854 /NCGR_PEP_ID=MMETSP1452-20131203/34979_1 /TAXON_ID=1181717 /ORGANISM="Synchroma pusillum, Strain CCMP3072" /LENGTH=185 /DNA_ID=CAMNT_0044155373 /DNA_START=29 /DNA_END=586 /DNA_ORIENTATION=-